VRKPLSCARVGLGGEMLDTRNQLYCGWVLGPRLHDSVRPIHVVNAFRRLCHRIFRAGDLRLRC